MQSALGIEVSSAQGIPTSRSPWKGRAINFESGESPLIYDPGYRSPRTVSEGYLNEFSMRAYYAGRSLYDFGRHQNAIMAFQYGLKHDPREIRLHLMLIVTYMGLGRQEDVDRQMRTLSQFGLTPDVFAAIQEKIDKWEHADVTVETLPEMAGDTGPYLSHSLLGADGRFGNQVLQYGVAQLYAEKYGMQYEAHDWIGRHLFGLSYRKISRILPFILEIEFFREDLFAFPPRELGICDRDCQGYFQQNTRTYSAYRKRFISLFKPVRLVERLLQPLMDEIRGKGKTLVALHIRRGDSVSQNRAANARIYLEWLRGIWPLLEDPVLFLASDDLENVRKDLEMFQPVTSEHFHMPIPGAEFYPDFYVLTQADYLGTSNSTFSFAASMVNERAKAVVRPNADNSALEPFDPWSSVPCVS